MAKTDTETLELIKLVNKRKAEIADAEKPNWKTNCSFSYTENSANTTNIHVEANVRNLICIAAFLIEKQKSYDEAAKLLGIEAPKFTWSGFSSKDWLDDLSSRINKIEINSKRKKLEVLENRLNLIISPELRTKMELEAIMSELK